MIEEACLEGYGGSMDKRREVLRAHCPCRNNELTRDHWTEMFRIAREGSLRERDGALHAIGTLLKGARTNREYRILLKEFRPQLDELMDNPRTARLVLGQVKPKHGHAHRGAARQAFRRVVSVLERCTPNEAAIWVNQYLNLRGNRRVSAKERGVVRLSSWVCHRVEFQPGRKVSEEELLKKAEQFLPSVFARSA